MSRTDSSFGGSFRGDLSGFWGLAAPSESLLDGEGGPRLRGDLSGFCGLAVASTGTVCGAFVGSLVTCFVCSRARERVVRGVGVGEAGGVASVPEPSCIGSPTSWPGPPAVEGKVSSSSSPWPASEGAADGCTVRSVEGPTGSGVASPSDAGCSGATRCCTTGRGD